MTGRLGAATSGAQANWRLGLRWRAPGSGCPQAAAVCDSRGSTGVLSTTDCHLLHVLPYPDYYWCISSLVACKFMQQFTANPLG
jgi:hypothetical protein